MARMIWHAGTGTVIAAEECTVVEVPDDVENAEDWIKENNPEPIAVFGGDKFIVGTTGGAFKPEFGSGDLSSII